MKQFDAIVIGGGILGCFVARNLRRWQICTLLLEKEEDVCTGITRANSAIVYAGYDNKPGSLKAELTVRGNANMGALCEELEVPFSRCGSGTQKFAVDDIFLTAGGIKDPCPVAQTFFSLTVRNRLFIFGLDFKKSAAVIFYRSDFAEYGTVKFLRSRVSGK